MIGYPHIANQLVALPVPYSGTRLRYDADGKIEGNAELGTLVNSGFISVEEAKTNGKQLTIRESHQVQERLAKYWQPAFDPTQN